MLSFNIGGSTFFINMSNTLRILLEFHTLIGKKLYRLSCNIKLVLSHEKIVYALSDPIP